MINLWEAGFAGRSVFGGNARSGQSGPPVRPAEPASHRRTPGCGA